MFKYIAESTSLLDAKLCQEYFILFWEIISGKYKSTIEIVWDIFALFGFSI